MPRPIPCNIQPCDRYATGVRSKRPVRKLHDAVSEHCVGNLDEARNIGALEVVNLAIFGPVFGTVIMNILHDIAQQRLQFFLVRCLEMNSLAFSSCSSGSFGKSSTVAFLLVQLIVTGKMMFDCRQDKRLPATHPPHSTR